MFGSVGLFELVIIAAVGLLVLGPEQFPKYAKMAARFIRDIRSYANEVQTEITKEIRPLTKELGDLRRINPEKYLDKIIGDDDKDAGPPNPEPHPSEVNFGGPATTSAPEPEAGAANPSSSVSYGSGSGGYPQEPDVPPTPEPAATPQPERLDG